MWNVIGKYRWWIAAGVGLLLLIVGLICGWKLARALGVGLAGAAGLTGAGKVIMQPDPAIEVAKRTVQDTLDAKERRKREAERIKEESRR
jgi:hypothetical protein